MTDAGFTRKIRKGISIIGRAREIIRKSLKHCWRASRHIFPAGGREWLLVRLLKPGRHARNGKTGTRKCAVEPPGFNLVGYLSQPTGLGQSARGLIDAMEHSAIEIDAMDFAPPGRQLLSREAAHDICGRHPVNLWCINGFEMFFAMRKYGWGRLHEKMNVCYWYWELENFPFHWRPTLDLLDEIWAASTFNAECFQKAAPPGVTVCRIPPTVSISPEPRDWRTYFSLPRDRFIALIMFDFGSIAERKNPVASIRAALEFKKYSNESIALVIKTRNMGKFPKDKARLLGSLDGVEYKIFDTDMSRTEIAGLYQACDAVVSLHRSEGFGLVPAEAMLLGKPVVATNWSATTDFMNAGNSWPIPYALVRNERTRGPYPKGVVWAEADTEAAGKALAEIASNPELAARKGASARNTILLQYSKAATREAIEKRYCAWRGVSRDPV